MVDYSKAIKELREKMLLTQTEFAKVIGLAYVTINRWENGHFIPTMKQRRKLAKLFEEYEIKMEVK